MKFPRDFDMGPSAIVSRGEPPKERRAYYQWCSERHRRRLMAAVENAQNLIEYCHNHKMECYNSTDCNYWRIKSGRAQARWTPTTAHLAICKNVGVEAWKHGKAHDWQQVIEAIGQWTI